MRTVRRHDYTPRVEMMPLIDVVFLLLTFFIFAMAVMERINASGVDLMSIQGGSEAVVGEVTLMEVDGSGGVWIDGRFVADDELDARLREIAQRPDAPPLVMALQVQAEDASVDRAPIVWRLEKRIREAGITDMRRLEELLGGSGVINEDRP